MVIISLNSNVPPLNQSMYRCIAKFCWLFFELLLFWIFTPSSLTFFYHLFGFNHYHHHHHVVQVTRISLILSLHFSLSFIASGMSSGLHPVSSNSCCMYVLAGCPAFAQPYVGVHKECLKGKHYAIDEEVKNAAKKWLEEQLTEFY